MIRQGRFTPANILLAVNGFFLLASFLSGTFVNVFLWKQSHSLLTLAVYNATMHTCVPLIFWGARSLKKLKEVWSIRLGLLFHGLFYGLVLLTQHQSNPYWMGVLIGIGAGFYWYGYNLLSLRLVKGKQRPRFQAAAGMISAIVGVVSPMLSGFIIIKFLANGYGIVFAASLIALVVSFIISFWIRKPINAEEQTDLAPLFQRRHPNWNKALLANLLQGGREGVFVFFAAILVFMTTGSEWALGKFSAWTALISSISFYIVGKWVKDTWYNESMILSSALSTGVISIFLWGTTPFTILVYGIVTAMFTPLFAVPFVTRLFQVIDEAHEKHEKEYTVEREMVLNLGRVISIAGFILTHQLFPREWIPAYLLLVGSLQIFAVLSYRGIRLEKNARSKA